MAMPLPIFKHMSKRNIMMMPMRHRQEQPRDQCRSLLMEDAVALRRSTEEFSTPRRRSLGPDRPFSCWPQSVPDFQPPHAPQPPWCPTQRRIISRTMATPTEQQAIVEAFSRNYNEAKKRMPPICKTQDLQRKDRGANGPIWVSRFAIHAPPEDDLRRALLEAVSEMSSGEQEIHRPEYASELHAEWTGPRIGPEDLKAPEPRMSEKLKFHRLSSNSATEAPVVLYVQGGGYVFGSTVTARPMIKKLCLHNRARYLSFNYRLSPRFPLPSPLLDLAVVYFTLLSPPQDALYSAMPTSRIVLAGESAGASLILGLIQFLLHLKRRGMQTVMFNGRAVSLDLPCGLALHSIPADFMQALPSAQPPTLDWLGSEAPWTTPDWPEEPFWPSDPPRGPIFADWTGMYHPLFSTVAVRDWTGSPPIWAALGEGESTVDGAMVVLQTAARQGVPVQLDLYEFMTHAFATVMPALPQAKHVAERWAEACTWLVRGHISVNQGQRFALGDLKITTQVDPCNMTPLDPEKAIAAMRKKVAATKHIVYTGQTGKRKAAL